MTTSRQKIELGKSFTLPFPTPAKGKVIDIEKFKYVKGLNKTLIVSSYGRFIFLVARKGRHRFIGSTIKNGKKISILSTAEKITPYIREIRAHMFKEKKSGISYRLTIRDPISKKYHTLAVGLTVARHFLPNPFNRSRINHINGDRYDCEITNLEWQSVAPGVKNKKNYLNYLKNADFPERKNSDVTIAIIKYLEGDNAEIEKILKNIRPLLFQAIYKIKFNKSHNQSFNKELVEDITQDTLLKIYEKINQCMFYYPYNPVGWFIRIAQRVAFNDFHKNKKKLLTHYNEEWFKHQIAAS